MRDNIYLQVQMIENKIERLNLQKDFYLKLIENRNLRSIDQNSNLRVPDAHSNGTNSSNFKH